MPVSELVRNRPHLLDRARADDQQIVCHDIDDNHIMVVHIKDIARPQVTRLLQTNSDLCPVIGFDPLDALDKRVAFEKDLLLMAVCNLDRIHFVKIAQDPFNNHVFSPQNKKYRCPIGTVSTGSHVRCSPFT